MEGSLKLFLDFCRELLSMLWSISCVIGWFIWLYFLSCSPFSSVFLGYSFFSYNFFSSTFLGCYFFGYYFLVSGFFWFFIEYLKESSPSLVFESLILFKGIFISPFSLSKEERDIFYLCRQSSSFKSYSQTTSSSYVYSEYLSSKGFVNLTLFPSTVSVRLDHPPTPPII